MLRCALHSVYMLQWLWFMLDGLLYLATMMMVNHHTKVIVWITLSLGMP